MAASRRMRTALLQVLLDVRFNIARQHRSGGRRVDGRARNRFHDRVPAFPATRRTIYQGYLFVGGVLLNESGMQHHPLTPMTDANLVRVLQQQTQRKVGLVDHAVVCAGASAIAERFATLRREGCGFAIVDAISDNDLSEIAAAAANMPLITGGSGLAQGLPKNFGC